MINAKEIPQAGSDVQIVIEVSGRLTVGDPADEFVSAAERQIEGGRKRFVVDLTNCSQIDSTGISVLVRGSIRAARAGGQMAIASVPGKVRDALGVTRLDEAIPVYPTVEEALNGLRTIRS